jgi:hypothetical protein
MYKWVSFAAILLLSAGCIGIFFVHFDGQLSVNQQDWGAFGSYVSGTVGVFAACLAVIWLILSVSIQQKELKYLKGELENSFLEQKKQTEISALTAILTSKQQAKVNDQSLLQRIKAKTNGKRLLVDSAIIEHRITQTDSEIAFYEGEIEKYLPDK